MTEPQFPPAPRGRSRVAIELLALLLVVAGIVMVLTAAWAADWRAGLAVLGVAVIGAGVVLGNDRSG